MVSADGLFFCRLRFLIGYHLLSYGLIIARKYVQVKRLGEIKQKNILRAVCICGRLFLMSGEVVI